MLYHLLRASSRFPRERSAENRSPSGLRRSSPPNRPMGPPATPAACAESANLERSRFLGASSEESRSEAARVTGPRGRPAWQTRVTGPRGGADHHSIRTTRTRRVSTCGILRGSRCALRRGWCAATSGWRAATSGWRAATSGSCAAMSGVALSVLELMPCGAGRRSAARVLARALRARGGPSAGRRPARVAYGGMMRWSGCVLRRDARGYTRCGCGREVGTPDAGVGGRERAATRGADTRGGEVRRGDGAFAACCDSWFWGRRRGKVRATGGVVGGAVCVRFRDAAHDDQSRWDGD